ncbi:MAG: serine/threonine protein kinase, partial [Kiritimatiellia bacterium]
MADTYFPSTTGLPTTQADFSDTSALRVDDPVDRYVVEAMIGEGATAKVYRVRHQLLGTHHALKVLRSRHPELRERLVQEGRIQAGLRHANVVAVTDVLDVYGHLGLLMDYVQGGALDTWLTNNKPPLQIGLRIFLGIVSGVGAAHRLGIVHRDLKPANILFDAERWHPWVTDFGLARHLHTNEERRTMVGQIVGTPAYMAPEQIRSSRDADARADVFALGAILYELVTGQRAFSGRLLQVLAKVAAGDFVPPQQLVPDLPPAVVHVILGCMTVHP